MTKIIELRAHHFMCIPDYRGLNYSEESKNSWDIITQQLKEDPETLIKIVDGPDMLCTKCPHSPEAANSCKNDFVLLLDNKVKELLGFKTNDIYSYKEISEKLMDLMDPQKHAQMCGDCMWRAYGVCIDTFKKTADAILEVLPK